MTKDRIYFNQSPQPTIGVEAELFTVSKNNFNLYPGAPAILNKFEDDIHVKEELLECIVGVNTGICQDVADVRSPHSALMVMAPSAPHTHQISKRFEIPKSVVGISGWD